MQSFGGETGVISPGCRLRGWYMEAVNCPDYMVPTLDHVAKMQMHTFEADFNAEFAGKLSLLKGFGAPLQTSC